VSLAGVFCVEKTILRYRERELSSRPSQGKNSAGGSLLREGKEGGMSLPRQSTYLRACPIKIMAEAVHVGRIERRRGSLALSGGKGKLAERESSPEKRNKRYRFCPIS